MEITKKEYDLLLAVRMKPKKARKLYAKLKPKNVEQWNIWLSDLDKYYYVEPSNAKVLDYDSTIHLNDRGETVAQAEFDRRFDMYFTRIISLVALITSILSIAIDAIQTKREAENLQEQSTDSYVESWPQFHQDRYNETAAHPKQAPGSASSVQIVD